MTEDVSYNIDELAHKAGCTRRTIFSALRNGDIRRRSQDERFGPECVTILLRGVKDAEALAERNAETRVARARGLRARLWNLQDRLDRKKGALVAVDRVRDALHAEAEMTLRMIAMMVDDIDIPMLELDLSRAEAETFAQEVADATLLEMGDIVREIDLELGALL